MKSLSMLLSFFERAREAKKENPHIKQGNVIFGSGITFFTSGIVLNITLKVSSYIQINFNLGANIGWTILALGTLLIITGILFSKHGLSKTEIEWKQKKLYYLRGISNQTSDPPICALPKMALWYHETPICLSIEEHDINVMFDDLKHSKKTIEDKIEQYQSKEIFFAGLARVPCLFFIGYSFRNAHSLIKLLDHDQQKTWFKLYEVEEPDININIEYIGINENSQLSDIAITIEFTLEILNHELPKHLQNNIVRIKPKTKKTHNLIKSQTTLEQIVEEVINELIKLNKKTTRLHLFIAAQSTVAFSLGRRYLDGQIGNITVYNYDPINKYYNWAISLTNNKLELEKYES